MPSVGIFPAQWLLNTPPRASRPLAHWQTRDLCAGDETNGAESVHLYGCLATADTVLQPGTQQGGFLYELLRLFLVAI